MKELPSLKGIKSSLKEAHCVNKTVTINNSSCTFDNLWCAQKKRIFGLFQHVYSPKSLTQAREMEQFRNIFCTVSVVTIVYLATTTSSLPLHTQTDLILSTENTMATDDHWTSDPPNSLDLMTSGKVPCRERSSNEILNSIGEADTNANKMGNEQMTLFWESLTNTSAFKSDSDHLTFQSKDKSLNMNALCQWEIFPQTDDERYPRTVDQVRCICATCSSDAYRPNGTYTCRQVHKMVPVIRRGECDEDNYYTFKLIDEPISIGCVFTRLSQQR